MLTQTYPFESHPNAPQTVTNRCKSTDQREPEAGLEGILVSAILDVTNEITEFEIWHFLSVVTFHRKASVGSIGNGGATAPDRYRVEFT
jgi:hypothetical protein